MKAKKIEKSMRKFARAHRAKNLVAPARTMTAATTPSAQSIRSIADTDTDAAIEDYLQRSTEQARADFANLPNPNAIDPDLGARLRPVVTGDSLVDVAIQLGAPMPTAMRVSPEMHQAAAAQLASIIPRNHR